jgi:hypothetical protein
MSEHDFSDRAGEAFPSSLLQRLLRWNRDDQDAFSVLVSGLKIGQNHQRDLIDWLEEIAIRDNVKISEVLRAEPLAKIESDPRLGRADKLKRIKEQVRRIRFPGLTECEDAVRNRIRQLRLEPEVHMTVPPGLEGGKVHIEFSAATVGEFKSCVRKLADAAAHESLNEALAILSGKMPAKPTDYSNGGGSI